MTARTPGSWPGLALLSMARPSDSRIVGPAPEALTEARACATQASQATQAAQASQATQATQAPAAQATQATATQATATGHTPAARQVIPPPQAIWPPQATARQVIWPPHSRPPRQAIWPPQATARQVIWPPHSRPPRQAIPHTAGHTLAAQQTTVAGHTPHGRSYARRTAGHRDRPYPTRQVI